MKAVVHIVTNHSKVKTQLQMLLSQIVTHLFQRSWEKDLFTLSSLFQMQSFPWLLAFVKEMDSPSTLLSEHLKSVVGYQKGKHSFTNLTLKVSPNAFEVPDSSRHFRGPFYVDYYYLLSSSSLQETRCLLSSVLTQPCNILRHHFIFPSFIFIISICSDVFLIFLYYILSFLII